MAKRKRCYSGTHVFSVGVLGAFWKRWVTEWRVRDLQKIEVIRF